MYVPRAPVPTTSPALKERTAAQERQNKQRAGTVQEIDGISRLISRHAECSAYPNVRVEDRDEKAAQELDLRGLELDKSDHDEKLTTGFRLASLSNLKGR